MCCKITELKHPDMIAFGLSKVNGSWAYYRESNVYKPSDVSWTTEPKTDGDCAAITMAEVPAVTYPCTEARRVICE
jgi:hypothetical protein